MGLESGRRQGQRPRRGSPPLTPCRLAKGTGWPRGFVGRGLRRRGSRRRGARRRGRARRGSCRARRRRAAGAARGRDARAGLYRPAGERRRRGDAERPAGPRRASGRSAPRTRRLGTTGLLPTLITDTPETTRAVVAAGIAAAEAGVPGFLGLHLEGPHLDPRRPGAHDPGLIRPMEAADLSFLCEAAGRLPALLVTLAPAARSRRRSRRSRRPARSSASGTATAPPPRRAPPSPRARAW